MSTEFLKSLFCKKHNRIIRQGECQECFDDGNAGFTNLLTCMNYNLDVLEVKND